MRAAVVVFPGTNCERDTVHALRALGGNAELVWHKETDLSDFDGVVLPGGFAHGDALRTGAIARLSPAMKAVAEMASEGRPVRDLQRIPGPVRERSSPGGLHRQS
jgi:phosphoribosylformylglycinamidine synthase subunit PurQ / glutaminase